MKIWKLNTVHKNFESYSFKNKNIKCYLELDKYTGYGKKVPSKFYGREIEVEEGFVKCDFPYFGGLSGVALFSTNAKMIFETLINNDVEFVKLCTFNENFYLLNITSILDCVDYKNAVLKKLDSETVVGLEKYAFEKHKISGYSIFKIKLNGRIQSTSVFVNDKFKCLVEKNKLKGFEFEMVWDSEIS